MVSEADPKKLIIACSAEEIETDEMITALSQETGLSKVHAFYKHFKHHSLRDWWKESDLRKARGALFVVMDTAWEAAQDIATAEQKEK